MVIISTGCITQDDTEFDPDIEYHFGVNDDPDILNNLTIDNIATIKLYLGKNINISDIEIFIIVTNDFDDYKKVEIIETGIWKIGETITIREINPDDAKALCYEVFLRTVDDHDHIAMRAVGLDGAKKIPINPSNKDDLD